MANYRECAVTTDQYAYDDNETNTYNIAMGYDVANDYITYQHAGHTHSPVFKSLRVNSCNYSPNRSPISEESWDNISQSYVIGGAYSLSGSIEANFRGWDFYGSGLLLGGLGNQTPSSVSSNASHKAGYQLELSQEPATLAIKLVDEQGSGSMIFRGVGITSFNFSMQMKQFCTVTMNFIAKRAEVVDACYNTGSTITGDPAPFYNPTLIWTPSGGSAETMKCKGFTMDMNRPMDQENMFLGSPFLQGLYYNGLTTLGGTITLGPGDWQRIRTMAAGSATDNVLDQGKREFYGTVAASNVIANAIPSGQFEIILHSPDGVEQVTKFTCNVAKLTEMSADASGRNMWNKTVNWLAQINTTDKFLIEIYEP